MPNVAQWPVPPAEPAVVLVDAATPIEHDVLRQWVREAGQGRDGPVRLLELSALSEAGNTGPRADVHAAIEDSGDPWLVPVRVAWLPADRQGDRSVRMRDVMLGLGDPRHPRPPVQRWLLRTAPERCQIVVGEPARVSVLRDRWQSVSGTDQDPARFIQFVARRATLALERVETQLVGAQYKVPRLVREELLDQAGFQAGLRKLAAELGRPSEDVVEEATSYLEEMVTGWSRLLVDLYVRLGRYNFRRGYHPELDFDADQVTRLREVASMHPLVFLPSHKSNLDTLVMNVALHDNGLPRTHVFGGINMAFWPIGPLFRRAGTVYIRRTTRDNPVYRFALREYIAFLIDKRFSLQFYIEGTRSRTGKLLPPRLGLLAYIIDAYRQGRSEDVVLVPVSIAYDQLQEVGDFAREARGVNKTAESISWLVRAFREQRGRYGRIYVRFAEPISLREALGPPQFGSASGDSDDLSLQKLAIEVSRRITQVTPITATSLVTLTLLGAQDRALTLDQVRAAVHDPVNYAVTRSLPFARDVRLDSLADVRGALAELERHHVVMHYSGGPEPVFAIGPDQHLAAAFYRNTVIHFFVTGALAQRAVARASQPGTEDPLAAFWEAALSIRDLLKFEFFFEPRKAFRETIAAELAAYQPDWEQRVARGGDVARGLLEEIRPLTAHAVLRSFLEAYGVVAHALVDKESDPHDERAFLAACLGLGKQYQLQKRIHSPESLSKPLFANGLKLATSRGLIGDERDTDARRHFLEEVRAALADIDTVTAVATDRVLALINAQPSAFS